VRAAVVEAPGTLVVRDLPDPDPGPYEARCEMLYGSVCTGTDRHVIEGTFPFPVQYPAVLGHESIGRVTEVGAKVRNLRPGDMVTRVSTPPIGGVGIAWGGFAEVGIARDHQAMRDDGLPAAEWNPYRVNQVVPPDLEPAAATMIITWRETLSQLTRMGAGPGTRVLILGSGGNGIAFAAHAANLAAAEVVVVGSPARESIARRAGATGYADYHDDIAARLPDRFDILIDAIGRRGQLDRGLPHLRPGGVAAIYGLDDWGTITIDPARARGTFTVYNDGYDEPETHEAVVGLMRDGRLDARLWLNLDEPYALEDIGAAVASLRERRTLKALVRLSGP
jgi:L-iditol 2-dehydrogenase